MPKRTGSNTMTPQEYLLVEGRSQLRHEYVDGHVFAMNGVTRRHNLIASNILVKLRAHLSGSPCRAYVSDVKVRVEATNSFYYPDVMVSCSHSDPKGVVEERPVLLVEVLSRSTAAIDRREKMLAYRQIESLIEYVIVHQARRRVQLHRRNEQSGWDVFEFTQPSQSVELQSIQAGPLTLTMDEIYEYVQHSDSAPWTVHEDADDELDPLYAVDDGEEDDGTCDW